MPRPQETVSAASTAVPCPSARQRIDGCFHGRCFCRREANMAFQDGAETVGQHDRRPPPAVDPLTRVGKVRGRLAGIEFHLHAPKSSAPGGADLTTWAGPEGE